MNEPEHKDLSLRAEAGDAQAQIELAQLLEASERNDEALTWLQKAVDGGDVHAKWLLAKRFLAADSKELNGRVVALINSAAEGDGEAAHFLAVLNACGIGMPRDWNTSFDHLTRSAELGFPLAREELLFLATGTFEKEQEKDPSPESWKRYREAIDLSAWIEVPPVKMVSRNPRIVSAEGVASPAMCDWIIEQAKPDRVAATVELSETGEIQQSEKRTNSTTPFDPFKMNMVLAVLRLRISALTGLSTGMEVINILHYAVGQRYEQHFDFIAAKDWQRVVTFLLYLNDDYEGGETSFPRIPLKHKGRKGDAMFFWNVDAQHQPDQKTLHEGSAPTRGEKWVLSQWIQESLRAPPTPHRF